MRLLKLSLPVLAIGLIVGIIACSKDSDAGNTLFKVRLTDNPFNAQEVNVDIEEVRVNYRDDSSGWTSLDTEAGIYNLLGLTNGVDTLLAMDSIPTGTLKEIRLVLGNDNTIKINDVVYPLTIPSGSASGLKIKLNKRLNASLDSVLIDFDAALSIHQNGNGDYMLKPVLKLK